MAIECREQGRRVDRSRPTVGVLYNARRAMGIVAVGGRSQEQVKSRPPNQAGCRVTVRCEGCLASACFGATHDPVERGQHGS